MAKEPKAINESSEVDPVQTLTIVSVTTEGVNNVKVVLSDGSILSGLVAVSTENKISETPLVNLVAYIG